MMDTQPRTQEMAQAILAVDDEPHMLMLLERIIRERTPYELVTTSNSLEVPDLLADRGFDVIICDFKMPGMSGLDILRLVDEDNRDEAVVLITAFGSMETANEAKQLGVFDYLTKPFKKEQLLTTIANVMTWQEARRQASSGQFEPAIFDLAPDHFQAAWVRRVARRTGDDNQTIANETGLPVETVTQLRDNNSGGDQ
ncbi:response regulator [candidate division GN15 bacterium]|nr:response regulator [candidate division GN15 bacterium]